MTVWTFLHMHSSELWLKIEEQCALVGVSTLLAICLGIPLAILIKRFSALRSPVLSLTALLWTIPSLALLAFLIPFMGIGFAPAIVALTLYALLPVIRNTYTGLDGVPAETIEAAQGLGFTRWQRLRLVELPLALPVIMSGVRQAVVMAVGIATLAAFIGAGGLGDFINRGLATNDNRLILLGALPAGAMALLLDFILASLERTLEKRRQHQVGAGLKRKLILVAVMSFAFVAAGQLGYRYWLRQAGQQIIVASKNFTEQFILAEIISQLIEAKTQLTVQTKLNLGTTAILQRGMVAGEIDIYPEYSGTAYLTVLKRQYQAMPSAKLFQLVKQQYQQQFKLNWLAPFGFSNSQALAINKSFAQQQKIATISQLAVIAPNLTIAAPAEFVVRPDAMPGLAKAYQLKFKSIRAMEPGLTYRALANKQVDVIMAFSTDGRIAEYNLQLLQDDKRFFPPYAAAPVVRQAVLDKHPELLKALKPLAGLIDDETMRRLNYAVDVQKQSPAEVAKQFLKRQHLI